MRRATPYFESVSAKSINVLGNAIAIAWDISGSWTPVAARQKVRQIIAFAVVEMARVGERDPHRMAFFAVSRARAAVTRHLATTGVHRIGKWRRANPV